MRNIFHPFIDLALYLLADSGRHAFIVSDALETEEDEPGTYFDDHSTRNIVPYHFLTYPLEMTVDLARFSLSRKSPPKKPG